MAKKKKYTGEIDKHVDWGNYELSGETYEVAGESVQAFIKDTLEQKWGFMAKDEKKSLYMVFADEENYNKYLEDPEQYANLKLAEFESYSNYYMQFNLANGTQTNNAILKGDTGNYISFYVDTFQKAEEGAEPVKVTEGLFITIIIARSTGGQEVLSLNGTTNENEEGYVKNILIDDYLGDGTNTITINVIGATTNSVVNATISYQVINLKVVDDIKIDEVHNISNNTVGSMTINWEVTGSASSSKFIEWYLDGEKQTGTTLSIGDGLESGRLSYTFNIDNGFYEGTHNIQYRAYMFVNGQYFYTPTYFRDFIVYKGGDAPIAAISMTIPIGHNPLEGETYKHPTIYGLTQYVNYDLLGYVYSDYASIEATTSIHNGGLLSAKVTTLFSDSAKNISLTPTLTGNGTLSIEADNMNIYEGDVVVDELDINIHENNTALVLDLRALGKYNDNQKEDWTYGTYTSTFEGFTWDDNSGWNGRELMISEGNKLTVNIAPFSNEIYSSPNDTIAEKGLAFEIEFSTYNVSDDDAVLCDMRGESGAGLLITGSEIKFGYSHNDVVSTKFKTNEDIRVAFVVYPNTTTVSSKSYSYIYVNGAMCGAFTYNIATVKDLFKSTKKLIIEGTALASMKLKHIRLYNVPLKSDEIVNNYILYRDTYLEMKKLYDRNNVYANNVVVDGTFSINNIENTLPVMLITNYDEYDETHYNNIETLQNYDATNKSTLALMYEVIFINTQDPTTSFRAQNCQMSCQGTSSMAYPRKNFRVYLKDKDKDKNHPDWPECILSTGITPTDLVGTVVNTKSKGKMSFKSGKEGTSSEGFRPAAPVNCWCLKADFAESSSSHNTGVARLWNDVMKKAELGGKQVCRTFAQEQAETGTAYKYDVRTCVDGFPIVLFYRTSSAATQYNFLGKYNMNNDKSTENVFGFCDIPGIDYSEYSYEQIEQAEYDAATDTKETTANYISQNELDKAVRKALGKDESYEIQDIDYINVLLDAPYDSLPVYNKLTIVLAGNVFKVLYAKKLLSGDENIKNYCVEFLENTHLLTNFAVDGDDPTNGFYAKVMNSKGKLVPNWTLAFEFRFPDGGESDPETFGGLSHLKELYDWIYSTRRGGDFDPSNATVTINAETKTDYDTVYKSDATYAENGVYNATSALEYDVLKAKKFQKEKWDYLDVFKMAAYYVYLMRFGAVDQVVKNSMFASEGTRSYVYNGEKYVLRTGNKCKWFYINYDNDTILGLDNDGNLSYGPDIDRSTRTSDGAWEDIDSPTAQEVEEIKGFYPDYDSLVAAKPEINPQEGDIYAVGGPGPYDPNVHTIYVWSNAGGYAYAGSNSTLWNNLTNDEEFNIIVSDIDDALYTAGLKYSEVIKMFNDEQADKWCERIVNRDAEYKYIQSLNEGKRNNLGKLQGPRSSHRKWWINKRFAIYDGKFISGDYKAYQISMKINQKATQSSDFAFSIVPTELMNYGWGITSRAQGQNIESTVLGERITFDPYGSGVQEFIDGTPLEVYEVPYISEIDLSCFQVGINSIDFSKAANPVLGTNLKKVVLGTELGSNDGERALNSNGMSGLNTLTNLEHLDIRGFKKLTSLDLLSNTNLKELLAFRSGLNSVSLPTGSKLQRLELPNTLASLSLDGANYLPYTGLKFEDNDLSRLTNITIKNCSKLARNSFQIFKNWYNQRSSFDGCVINMEGINWQITYDDFEVLQDFEARGERLALKGTIEIIGDWTLGDRDEVSAKVHEIKEMFGEDCFKANGRTDVTIVCSPFIILNASQFNMVGKSGNEITFTCDVYPYESGALDIHYEVEGDTREGLTLFNNTVNGEKIGILRVETERVDAKNPYSMEIKGVYTDKNFVTHTSKLAVDIINPTYPNSINVEGRGSVHSGETHQYTIWPLTSAEQDATGTYEITYELSGNLQYIDSHSMEGNVITLNFSDAYPETYGTVILKLKVSFLDTFITRNFDIKVLNDNVIMTIDTNPVVFTALYNAGLVDDNAVLLRSVAEGITNLGTALSNLNTAFTFDEISDFTGLSSIANRAFANSYITNITIPDFISSIGTMAFDACPMLTHVDLPINNNFTEIKTGTFRNCSKLSKIVIPESVTQISKYAFGGDTLIWNITTSVTANNAVIISDNLETIEDYAFEERNVDRNSLSCRISSITITEKLAGSQSAHLDKYLLLAPYLKEFIVNEDNLRYQSIDNVLYAPNGYVLYRYPAGKVLDAESNGVYETHINCHRIDELAFFKAGAFSEEAETTDEYIGQLWTLRISNLSEDVTYKAIGDYAFERSTIRTLDLSNNDALRIIPKGAFENCKKLGEILYPNNLNEIQPYAYNYCEALTSLTIPDSVEIIGNSAITNCSSLERLVLPRNMRISNGTVCMACNSLTSVMIPCYHTGATEYEEGERTNPYEFNPVTIDCGNLQQYEQYKRYDENEQLIEEDDGTIYFVYEGAIYKRNNSSESTLYKFPKGRTGITFAEGTIAIGANAFSGSNLREIVIPNTVRSIGAYAFSSSILTSIVIPGSVKTISSNAFYSSSRLATVYMEEGVESIESRAFYQCGALANLHLPETLYRGSADGTIGQIGSESFMQCGMRDLVIPSRITKLGMWEFANCNSLRNVIITSRNFEMIGARPFRNVPLSSMVILSNRVPSIDGQYLDTNYFSGMTLSVPYGMVSSYEANANWSHYKAQGMRIQEFAYDIDNNIYVKIENYNGTNPYIVDPEDASWGVSYVGTLVTSGEYEGYYSFNGLVGVIDSKPLEIRDGSITGAKVTDITLKYDVSVYELSQTFGMMSSTRALSSKAPETETSVSQADYDRLKCDVNTLKIKLNKLLGE